MRFSDRGAWAVVTVRGELDLYTVALLKDELAPIIASRSRLLFDFTEVQYLDSSAIGVVVGAFNKINAKGGCTRIVCPDPIRKIFKSVGLDKQIEFFESLSGTDDQSSPSSPDPTSPTD